MITKALIYCRVSSQRQVDEGNGLSSQEQRCRTYCQNKGYSIEKVFSDGAVSGKLFERPAMQALLQYVDSHPTGQFVVVFDDLSRFSRDMEVQLRLRTEFQSRGIKRECLNFTFDETPESEYAELVLTAGNQYQRQSNKRQVIQKMKARLERGYWPFCMPKGLINQKHPVHGKILVRREPYATIYKEAIEKYRDGVLPSILDFQSFVNDRYKENEIVHRMSFSTAAETLKTILYAGWVEYPKWEIPRMQAQHEGFISIETYNAVQKRLRDGAKPHRKDYSLDFPLRPLVSCDSCGIPMTGSYHTGRTEKYAHYFCRNARCEYGNKNVPKAVFEKQFEELLLQVKPDDGLVDLTKDVLLEIWNNRLETSSLQKSNAESEIEKIKNEIERYLERVGNTKDETIISLYETKIKELIEEKRKLEEELPVNVYTDKNFGTALEKVFNVLKKPLDIWRSDNYNDKRTILLMYFEDKLRYNYETGFGTANLAYPVGLITKNRSQKNGCVEMSESDSECKSLI